MENDFIKRLEERAAFKDPWDDWELAQESLDHIRKLEAEIGVLFAANVRLNSRADLDSDGYVDRIEKLEAALRDLSDGWECCPVSQAMRRVARDALEKNDD